MTTNSSANNGQLWVAVKFFRYSSPSDLAPISLLFILLQSGWVAMVVGLMKQRRGIRLLTKQSAVLVQFQARYWMNSSLKYINYAHVIHSVGERITLFFIQILPVQSPSIQPNYRQWMQIFISLNFGNQSSEVHQRTLHAFRKGMISNCYIWLKTNFLSMKYQAR